MTSRTILILTLVGVLVVLAGPASAQNSTTTNVSECTIIDESGTYTLTQSITDTTTAACIDIRVSGVTLDGDGFTITGGGVGDSIGIYGNGTGGPLSDVTVTNVAVTDWERGIVYQGSTNGLLTNTAVDESTDDGIVLDEGAGNNLTNNTITNSTNEGLQLTDTDDNTLTGNTVHTNDGEGIQLDGASNNTLRANTARLNGNDGIELQDSSNDNRLAANTVLENGNEGIESRSSDRLNLIDNDASANGGTGFDIYSSTGAITLTENTARNNTDGFYIEGSDITLTENTARNNTEGFHIEGSNLTLTDNTARNNTDGFVVYSGFFFDGPVSADEETTLTNNTASENVFGIVVLGGSATLTDNDVTDSVAVEASSAPIAPGTGLVIIGADNTIEGTTATGNAQNGIVVSSVVDDGFVLLPATENTLVHNEVSQNDHDGISLVRTTGNDLFDNVVRDNGRDGIHFVNDSAPTAAQPPILASAASAATQAKRDSSGESTGDSTVFGALSYDFQNTAHPLGLQPVDPTADGTFSNNDVTHNARYGVLLDEVSGHTLARNIITDSGAGGVRLNASTENSVFDNVFNNSANVVVTNATGTTNEWNESTTKGPNIIGGPSVGGNYYAKPGDAEGFSETCDDLDGNGFCDEPNPVGNTAANTDFFPLTVPGEADIAVSPAEIEFEEVIAGESATETVTVSNEGDATLSVAATHVTGTNESAFAVTSGGAPFTLAPGASRPVTVEFAPTTMGTCTKKASLEIESADTDESQMVVGLSGTSRPAVVDGFDGPPRDPDGDCLFEDVNADGTVNVVDVQALFANRNQLKNRPDRAAFNFNSDTEDGTTPTIDVVDVQKLFAEVIR